jgi:pyridoxamine 5'-phosphate oxidase
LGAIASNRILSAVVLHYVWTKPRIAANGSTVDQATTASGSRPAVGLEGQVRIDGRAEKVSAEESDAYFATRPVESRWSVYASRQSEVIESRDELESRFTIARQEYGDGVPRPAWWGGYRIVPDEFEFWQGRPNRLHDRLRYVKEASGVWRRERLAP